MILYTCSMYGHIATLSDSIVEGIKKNSEVQVDVYQIPETLSEDVLAKMHAPAKVLLMCGVFDMLHWYRQCQCCRVQQCHSRKCIPVSSSFDFRSHCPFVSYRFVSFV